MQPKYWWGTSGTFLLVGGLNLAYSLDDGIGWALVAAAAACFARSIMLGWKELEKVPLNWVAGWGRNGTGGLWPFRSLLALDQAAERAAAQTESLWAIRKLSGDEPIHWCATFLIAEAEYPVYGCEPYRDRKRRRMVSTSSIRQCALADDCMSLRDRATGQVMHEHLAMLRSDVRKRIRDLRRIDRDL